MQHQRLPLRPVCSAQNAFDVSRAIRLAFSDALTSSHVATHGRPKRSPPQPRLGTPYFSTIAPSRRQNGQAELLDSTGREKIGVGGTFANYQALTTAPYTAKGNPPDVTGTRAESEQEPTTSFSRYSSVVDRNRNAVPRGPNGGSIPGQVLKEKKQRIWRPEVEGVQSQPADHMPPRRQIVHRIWRPKIEGMPEKASEFDMPVGVASKVLTRASYSEAEEELRKHRKLIRYEESQVRGLDAWKEQMLHLVEQANELARMPVKLSDTRFIRKARKMLSYQGIGVWAPRMPMTDKLEIPWALQMSDRRGKSGMQALSLEIQYFVKYMKPTAAETAARKAVITEVRALIEHIMGPEVQSEVFGSEKTGLATAVSDIDIRISYKVVEGDGDPRNLSSRMKALAFALGNQNEDFICVVMRNSRLPLISAQHKRTGIDIQIVSSPDTKTQQNLTLRYINETPNLQPLYILLRTAFGIRGLADVFYGGTGSYGLFIMLVAALKRRQSNPKPTETLSEHLFRFLNFWRNFNTHKYGITLTPSPHLFKKHDPWNLPFEMPVEDYISAAYRRNDPVRAGQWCLGQRRLYQPYLLCLQDPADPLNDLGRKGNAIMHVKTTLSIFADILGDECSAFARKRLPPGKSMLTALVGRCHELYSERRKKMEEFGLEVLKQRGAGGEKSKGM